MSRPQHFRVRLPGYDRPIMARAVVHREEDYRVELQAIDGHAATFSDLPRELRLTILDAILRTVLAAEAEP